MESSKVIHENIAGYSRNHEMFMLKGRTLKGDLGKVYAFPCGWRFLGRPKDDSAGS